MYSIPEVDLHGMNKDEALAEVDRELNHCFIQETEDRRLQFVTGHGGVLRGAITEYIKTHPLVKEISVDGASVKVLLEDLT